MGIKSLESPLEREGRRLPEASTSTFLATAAFVPVWAVTVLPLSVLYQVSLAAIRPILNRVSPQETIQPQLDSGYVVNPADIIPRPDRKYDVAVLGVTGFTGYLAARHLAKTYGVNQTVKWAVAGRSASKLDKMKIELAKELQMDEILLLDAIIVDTSIASTLPKLVRDTRVVATTAGPYTLYGSSVVEFCAKFGTHYVDITGEVDWIKAMICQWQPTAQQTGAKLIPFCGHDSIPWDLSVMELQRVLKEKGDNVVSVEFWDEMRSAAPGGTYATMLNAISGRSIQAPRVEFDPFLRLPDGSKSKYVCKPLMTLYPRKSSSPWSSNKSGTNEWTAPFIMAVVNGQVVRWSYALRSQGRNGSISYTESALHPNLKTAFVNYAGLAMFGSMLFNPLTSSLLQKYVIPKPGEGPSMDAMENKHFLCVKGEAIGENGNRAESIFYLNKDAGCLETSRLMIESALCLALNDAALPSPGGGFLSPSVGLGTVLLERLKKTGTYFAVQAYPPVQARL